MMDEGLGRGSSSEGVAGGDPRRARPSPKGSYTTNPPVYPVVYFGTLAAESTRIVAHVPEQGKGVVIRALFIYTAEEVPIGPTDHWVFELGTVGAQLSFTPKTISAYPYKGLTKGQNPVFFARLVPYDAGEVIALRARPVGSPDDITELQIVVGIEEP